MLIEETFQKLGDMRMYSFLKTLREQLAEREPNLLSYEEKIGILIDREWTERMNRRLQRRLQYANLREKEACLEGIDYLSSRELDRSFLQRLGNCDWVRNHHPILITGPTGCGKTYLACALAQKACREGFTIKYWRIPKLIPELAVSRGDGSLRQMLMQLEKIDVLILDDFGLVQLGEQERHDILEILEDRYLKKSTIVTSQLPVNSWHDRIGDSTIADAILDRLVHQAYKIVLTGNSVRKEYAQKEQNQLTQMKNLEM
jgi:DNA replication protein DnaC